MRAAAAARILATKLSWAGGSAAAEARILATKLGWAGAAVAAARILAANLDWAGQESSSGSTNLGDVASALEGQYC
jgi:hypothetical protein